MKILIRTDEHFSQYSSILRNRGEHYSLRLEESIKSIIWSEQLAVSEGCSMIMDLGDFFDKSELNAEEISALQEIKWENLPHYFLVGNHEMGINSLEYSSAHLFRLCPNSTVIDKATVLKKDGFDICMIPYVLEANRQHIEEYLTDSTQNKRIIFSHNDIKGIQMGAFLSKEGFGIEEIENNCDIFINGHLHNGTKITDKIINLGNLTGQNFSENALIYSHNVMILDTDTMSYTLVENPYAFNFYKLGNISQYKKVLFKTNSVVTCSCLPEIFSKVKENLEKQPEVLIYRITLDKSNQEDGNSTVNLETLQMADHLEQFKNFVLENIGTNETILCELTEVLK